MNRFEYSNKVINPVVLSQEIEQSTIPIKLSTITTLGNHLTLEFAANLIQEDIDILNALLTAHNPLRNLEDQRVAEVRITELPESTMTPIDKIYQERSLVITTNNTVGPFVAKFAPRYPIVILGGDICSRQDSIGDVSRFEIHFAPNDIVGHLLETTIIGSNSIRVSETAARHINKTFNVSLMRSNHTIVDLGECWNKNGQVISVENQITEEFQAGTLVLTYASLVPYVMFTTHPQQIFIGNKTMRGRYIPAGVELHFRYWNHSLTAKVVSCLLEYYV